MRLQSKTAVITGAGRGIGAAVAEELVAAGARVVLAARSVGEIEALAESLSQGRGTAWAVPCDVTDPDQVAALAAAARELLGQVDIIVNNAGIADSAPLARTDPATWEKIMAVNVTGVYQVTRALLPGMLERGWGRVITIASVAGLTGAPYITAYSASKHAVIGFTRSLAAEVAAKGVTVNAVCPGYVDTPMTEYSIANIVAKTGISAEQAMEGLRAMSPQHRLFAPAEVAYLVLSLADPRAGGVNGQSWVLDGGALLR